MCKKKRSRENVLDTEKKEEEGKKSSSVYIIICTKKRGEICMCIYVLQQKNGK
jgi:hypothetical protein